MAIQLWLFRAGDRLELWEEGNGPVRVNLSRGVLSIADGKFAAKKLARSIVRISRQSDDEPITVFLRPHPALQEMDPNFYTPLTLQQITQAKVTLEQERQQQEAARQGETWA